MKNLEPYGLITVEPIVGKSIFWVTHKQAFRSELTYAQSYLKIHGQQRHRNQIDVHTDNSAEGQRAHERALARQKVIINH